MVSKKFVEMNVHTLSRIFLRLRTILTIALILAVLWIMRINGGLFSSSRPSAKRISTIIEKVWNSSQCNIQPITSMAQFFDYVDTFPAKCNDQKLLGRHFKKGRCHDGQSVVCFDEKLNIQPMECVALSYGINYDFSVDDELDRFGCKVSAFDPSFSSGDHQRSQNVHFYKLGIGTFTGNSVYGKVDRFENTVTRLGLNGHNIDFLKFDAEGTEFYFFQDVVVQNPNALQGVKQLEMMIHTGFYKGQPIKGTNFGRLWNYFQLLECYGFRLVNSSNLDVNAMGYEWGGKRRSSCLKLLWIQDKEW